jgi:hypothetical protein
MPASEEQKLGEMWGVIGNRILLECACTGDLRRVQQRAALRHKQGGLDKHRHDENSHTALSIMLAASTVYTPMWNRSAGGTIVHGSRALILCTPPLSMYTRSKKHSIVNGLRGYFHRSMRPPHV